MQINWRRTGCIIGAFTLVGLITAARAPVFQPVGPALETYSNQKIVVVGHRGVAKLAPENTIAAHEAALALGARAIEFDVRFTKDGHAVVIHDATVNRTTNGRGRVSKMTLAQIKALDAGSWKGDQFTGETIPTLREALRNIKGRAVVDIDFKGGPPNASALLIEILDDEGFRDGPLVTVFARPWHVAQLAPLAPHYALRPHFESARKTGWLTDKLGIKVMGLRRRSFSFANAAAIKSNDLILFANIMGRADGVRGVEDSIRAGARFIQTDNPEIVAPYLAARGLLETCVLGRDFQCEQPSTTPPEPAMENAIGIASAANDAAPWAPMRGVYTINHAAIARRRWPVGDAATDLVGQENISLNIPAQHRDETDARNPPSK